MKKIFLALTGIVVIAFAGSAQNDTMYIMKAGVVVDQFDVNTDIDSIIFYKPQTQTASTFTDSRDNTVYQTVTINNQVWMAENLAYDVGDGCWAYDNDESNVATYGRLYTWEAAKTACPSGWHLPTDDEWEQLAQYVSDQKGPYNKLGNGSGWSDVGKHLKATSGWDDNGNGTDDYGFSALPGGYSVGNFYEIGSNGFWWSATEYSSSAAWNRIMYSRDGKDRSKNEVHRGYTDKGSTFSVRCVRD